MKSSIGGPHGCWWRAVTAWTRPMPLRWQSFTPMLRGAWRRNRTGVGGGTTPVAPATKAIGGSRSRVARSSVTRDWQCLPPSGKNARCMRAWAAWQSMSHFAAGCSFALLSSCHSLVLPWLCGYVQLRLRGRGRHAHSRRARVACQPAQIPAILECGVAAAQRAVAGARQHPAQRPQQFRGAPAPAARRFPCAQRVGWRWAAG